MYRLLNMTAFGSRRLVCCSLCLPLLFMAILAANAQSQVPRAGSDAEGLIEPPAQLTAEQAEKWKWDYEPLELLAVRKQPSFVTCVAPIPNTSRFILAGREVTMWSALNDQPEHSFSWPWVPDIYMEALAVSPDGKWFVTADCLGKLYRWELGSQKLTVTKDLKLFDVMDIAISSDGRELAILRRNLGKQQIAIYDPANFQFKREFSLNEMGPFLEPLQPEVARRLLYIGKDRLVAICQTTSVWNTSNGTRGKSLQDLSDVGSLGMMKDGQSFFTLSSKEMVVWDKAQLKSNWSIANSHDESSLVAFAPEDKYFAKLDSHELKVWETNSRQPLQKIDAGLSEGNQAVGMHWIAHNNLLIVVEQHGLIRVWGTRQDGAKHGLTPMIDGIRATLGQRVPATSIETQAMLDLQCMPYPPNSRNVFGHFDMFVCEAPLDINDAKSFYRYHLGQMGWREVVAKQDDRHTIWFGKQDFHFKATFDDQVKNATKIRLGSLSNFKLNTAPRLQRDDLQLVADSDELLEFRTQADLLTIECGLLRAMKASGWVQIPANSDMQDARFPKVTGWLRQLKFMNGGTVLGVVIGRADDQSIIKYGTWPARYSVPFPPGTFCAEFDTDNGNLVALSTRSSEELKAFYEEELPKQGWVAMPNSPTPQKRWYRANFIYRQKSLELDMRQTQVDISTAICGGRLSSIQVQKLHYPDSPLTKQQTDVVTKYVPYETWLNSQDYKAGYDSIDRYEAEMRAILSESK